MHNILLSSIQMLKFIHFHHTNISHFPTLNPFLYKQTYLRKQTSLYYPNLHLHLNSQLSVVSDDSPVEVSPSIPSIFATNDDPTPLQLATSVLLTGSISVFLFRFARLRAKRTKELRMTTTGEKALKEEPLDSLKAIGSIFIGSKKDPSPVQALLGGIAAAVIALILYKFTTTIEAALNRETLSDIFSDPQITMTIRIIINGLCYLATFVFALNSVGLFVYSGKLALNSFSDDSKDGDPKTDSKKDGNTPDPPSETPNNSENIDTDQTS